jgi:DNA-binding transcriptional regulator YdaS (Cro superfamily)
MVYSSRMTKQQAIEHFGSAARLARELGVSRQSVHNWADIPIGRQYQIEVLTRGTLQAERAASGDQDRAA